MPPPGSAFLTTWPADVTTVQSMPAIGSLSPGLTTVLLAAFLQLGIRRLEPRDLLALLDARPVVDVVLDRYRLRQRLHAADMVDVVMRRYQVVDLLDAGRREHRRHPILIALAGIGAVEQHRLAVRRDEQRGFAALDVDDVDVERLARRLAGLGLGAGVPPPAAPRGRTKCRFRA